MLNRIKELLTPERTARSPESRSGEELHLAAASLLVESASMDGNFDENERQCIITLLQNQFELSIEETITLIDEAEHAVEGTGQLYGFTRVVKDCYDEGDRINIIEMLWEVAYADGNADPFEKNLILRVAGLIFVSDKDKGLAKKRVMARLGISD